VPASDKPSSTKLKLQQKSFVTCRPCVVIGSMLLAAFAVCALGIFAVMLEFICIITSIRNDIQFDKHQL
jgi:hypothetical protein